MNDPKSGPSESAVGRGGFRLEVLAGTGAGTIFDANPGATINMGRARDNAFVLRDPVVSRHHAVIEPTASGYRIRDLGSLAGVVRRGQRIPDGGAGLAEGDELELGPLILRFTLRPASPQKSASEPPRTAPREMRPPPAPDRPAPPPQPMVSPPARPEPAAAATRKAGRDDATPQRTPPSPIGSFGSYQILRSLPPLDGSTLDLAIDPRTGAEVEIQRIALANLGWLVRRRFVRECGQLLQIEHPNLSVATDAGRVADTAFRVYPHVPGARIDDLMRDCRRHLTIPLAIFVGREMSRALSHVESTLGRGYRAEVTAENVLVSKTGTVLLQRLGAPRLPSDKNPGIARRYLAPEESGTRRGDHRSAIFALGILLYELLGREPVDDSQKLSLRSIDTVRIDVPASLADAVMRALEIRPEHRFDSASEMERALTQELTDWIPNLDSAGLERWMAERYPDTPT